MKIISHRGNQNGANPAQENNPEYILEAFNAGFDVEIDLWKVGAELFLGHDEPQYNINSDYLLKTGLWIHCKNIEAALYVSQASGLNAFWQQDDDIAITTKGYLWTNTGKELTERSIAVMPENDKEWDIGKAYGVCTDYPLIYEGAIIGVRIIWMKKFGI